jgi:hypothetical protein
MTLAGLKRFSFAPVLLAAAALASAVPAHAQSVNTVMGYNALATNITPYFKCPASLGCPAGQWVNFGQIGAHQQFTWDLSQFPGEYHFTYTPVGAPPPPNEGAKEVAAFIVNGSHQFIIVMGAGTQTFILP